ncbi:hypothetical protein BJY04DRAFT_216865 [Aspergillus karnatakaensis]|uniref:uncharacterized protein n=1 Tax=Aspergillus karnatakaensis TaxID=1810916 RepID=UPI003CCD766C
MADSVSTSNDNDNDSRSTAKFTRCRTGCLRCRKRRRKCDELKPQCQNCIDKNFDCNYGVQVTFLPKNTFTVTAGEIQAPVNRRASYGKIQFVNEDPLSIDAETLSEHLPQSSPTPPMSSTPLPPQSPISSNRFSTKDEFAVQGLLALGTQPAASDSIPISTILNAVEDGGTIHTPLAVDTRRMIGGSATNTGGDVISPGFIDGILGAPTPSAQPALNFGAVNNSISGAHVNADSISDSRKMKLLQNYRYGVAPWLDIHDLSHPFGITALQTAVNSTSPRLLSALLSLSETCLHQQSEGRETASGVRFEDAVVSPNQFKSEVHNFTEAASISVFEELRGLVSDVAGTWAKRNPNSNYTELQSLVHSAYGSSMEAAVYWMFLRIDIGKSLANNTPLRTPLPNLPLPSFALLTRAENTQTRVNHYAQVLLWLCGKALHAYHHQDQEPQFPMQGSWLQIFEELTEWHFLRPQEFQPMVEIELNNDTTKTLNPGSEFPLLLFTNGAGALCNQLYHTAMLLMLECKPRTALLNHHHHQHSAVLSTLWHAQRVCGIALNNDRPECWDPCLLASFLLAAKHMTHETQQVEIVTGFESIHALTGWSVGEYLSQLREEWSFLDGVE